MGPWRTRDALQEGAFRDVQPAYDWRGQPTNNPKTLDSLIEGTKFGGELRFEDSDGEAIIKKP